MTTQILNDIPDHLAKAKKYSKELKEALEVCKKIEDQVSWACDFTSFASINRALEPLYEAVDDAREQLEHEQDHIDNQIEDYFLKLYQFDSENAIEL
jgi:hypothetical protein